MRTLEVLLAVLLLPLPATAAQEIEAPEGATIASAQVSGLDLAKLSPGLQEDIAGLAGTPLSRERLRELVARIEAEQPWFVAAVRAAPDSNGDVRVVFVVAHLRDKDREANVNARYVVERVEIKGVPEDDLSQELRDALHALAGRRLDSDEADRLESRLKEALPDHDVRRRVVRGNQPGQIQLLFDVSWAESARWIPFERYSSKFVYHSKLGWGGYFSLPLGGRDFRLVPTVAIDNADDLIEEYSGFGLRLESRNLGTERLGASLEWSIFDQDWQTATLTALEPRPHIAGPYEQRSTLTPLVTFAFTPQVRVSAGVSISELDPLTAGPDSQMANTVVASIGYSQRWKGGSDSSQSLEGFASVRAGSDALESDLVYRRYFGRGSYRSRWARHSVHVSSMAGSLSGDAPLFERFSLGDSQTLRGWNKYDIAPAGGDRMFHASLEYRYSGWALFIDTGSVWDRDTNPLVRVAAGAGFHHDNVFLTLGFPLNTDQLRAMFMMGIRY
jgi:hypothetical protein